MTIEFKPKPDIHAAFCGRSPTIEGIAHIPHGLRGG
jgi:hypothetical protein